MDVGEIGTKIEPQGHLIETPVGKVLVAELEDGAVESVSVEAAVKSLQWILQAGNLPEEFDTRELEVVIEYLNSLI